MNPSRNQATEDLAWEKACTQNRLSCRDPFSNVFAHRPREPEFVYAFVIAIRVNETLERMTIAFQLFSAPYNQHAKT